MSRYVRGFNGPMTTGGKMGTMPPRLPKVRPVEPREPGRPMQGLQGPFGAPMPQGPSMGIGDFMRNQIQGQAPTRGWAPNHRGTDGPMMPPAQPGQMQAQVMPYRGQVMDQQQQFDQARNQYTNALAAYQAPQQPQTRNSSTGVIGPTDPSEAYYAELLRGGPQMAQRAQMADQRLAQNHAMAASPQGMHASELARGGPQMAMRARQADARSQWNRFQGHMQGYGMRTQWR